MANVWCLGTRQNVLGFVGPTKEAKSADGKRAKRELREQLEDLSQTEIVTP